MELGTTVNKSSKEAKILSENMSTNHNQLQFIPVTLFDNGVKLDCYAVLENYSSCSYTFSWNIYVNQVKNHNLAY